MKNENKTKIVATSAVFASLVFITTVFFHITVGSCYIHLGDAFIYLSAALLPSNGKSAVFKPRAMLAAGVGAALADFFLGYVVYAAFTFFIKMMLTLAFSPKGEKILSPRNIAALFIAFPITVGGYLAVDTFLYGFGYSVQYIWANSVQAASSAVVFAVIAVLFDKFDFKRKILK